MTIYGGLVEMMPTGTAVDAVSVLALVYVLGGLLTAPVAYVGWGAEFPSQRSGPWVFDSGDMVATFAWLACWPIVLSMPSLRDVPAAGWRYLTTDWDPWEKRDTSPSWGQLIGPPALHPMSTSVAGYNGEPDEVVEGSDPITAHRVWRLFGDERGPVLGSTVTPHLYEGPVARADRDHLEAGYGLFAAKPEHPFYDGEKPRFVVEGKVELFGRVVEGKKGYRAEKLRITSLILRPGGWHKALTRDPSEHFILPASVYAPQGAKRQFCACDRAERPWPYPYTEVVEALAERYRCDVRYEAREGTNAFDGSCFSPPQHLNTWPAKTTTHGGLVPAGLTAKLKGAFGGEGDGDGWDSDRLIKPTDLIQTPKPEDIYRYARGA